MTSSEEINLESTKREVMLLLGRRIQKLRESKDMSQVDLAGKMKGAFDTTNISRIESGRTNPTIFTLYKIADALEVPLSKLVSFED